MIAPSLDETKTTDPRDAEIHDAADDLAYWVARERYLGRTDEAFDGLEADDAEF